MTGAGTGEDEGLADVPLGGGTHSEAVRVGDTVRRRPGPWSAGVLDVLRHLERAGFDGAPRARGFDDLGREVVTYVDGEVGARLPDVDAGPLDDAGHWVWRDEVLVGLGRLLRRFHDAAASFPSSDQEWQVPTRTPVETVCHNDLSPSNVVFRAGVPVALIDWEAAAPGPRAADLGFAAWHWVPLWSDVRCRAAGLPTGTAAKARRLRLLLDAYGSEPDPAFLATTLSRMRQFLDHLDGLAAAGSAWEVDQARRGGLRALTDDITWMEAHADELVGW